MQRRPRAAIYARISQDRSAGAAGIDRQIRDCRTRAEELGWEVVAVYQDNDASAYQKRARTQYRRLLRDIDAGEIQAVVAWHPDRLYRRLEDLAEFVDVCKEARALVNTVQTGHVDLNTPSGRMIAGILGVTARFESEHKAERVRAASAERAAKGLHHGGRRPFGYEPDGMTVRPGEASIIREIATRFLAGEGIVSIARWLNDTGVPTVGGGRWHVSAVRQMLRSPRLSGQVQRHGEILGPAQWPAILDLAQTAAIRAILDDPGRKQQRTARRYLLSGLLVCSKCGSRLVGDPKPDGDRYTCKRAPHRQVACGGTSIKSEPVDELITEAVLQRLDGSTPTHHSRAAQMKTDAATEEASARETLEMLADMLGDGSMSRQQYERAAKKAQQRLDRARASQPAIVRSAELERWRGSAGALRRAWPDLSLTRQRAIIGAVLETAVITPGIPGARSVDPDRVVPTWRA